MTRTYTHAHTFPHTHQTCKYLLRMMYYYYYYELRYLNEIMISYLKVDLEGCEVAYYVCTYIYPLIVTYIGTFIKISM